MSQLEKNNNPSPTATNEKVLAEENANLDEQPQKRGRGRPKGKGKRGAPKKPVVPLTPEQKEEKKSEKVTKLEKKLNRQEAFANMARGRIAARKEKIAAMTEDELKEFKEGEKAKKDANKKQRQADLQFSVVRVRRVMKKTFAPKQKFTKESVLFTAAVLEYMTAEVLELSGNISRDHKRKRITPRDIMKACRADSELDKFVGKNTTFAKAGIRGVGVHHVLRKNNMPRNAAGWETDPQPELLMKGIDKLEVTSYE